MAVSFLAGVNGFVSVYAVRAARGKFHLSILFLTIQILCQWVKKARE
jgi:hypothetical protein